MILGFTLQTYVTKMNQARLFLAFCKSLYSKEFPEKTVFLCVIDPGVGSDKSFPIVVEADGKYFVGPGELLFSVIKANNKESYRQYRIGWRPLQISNTFYGRDLYAPVAAWLALAEREKACLEAVETQLESHVSLDLFELIYIDKYGNAMTGISKNIESLGEKLLGAVLNYLSKRDSEAFSRWQGAA